MIFEQHYLDCLSQASYLIGDETTGRAVVVDPRRDVDVYLDAAADAGLTIELVIETHFHADFLSGHLELAAATGAEIGYGAVAEAEFPIRRLTDGERIVLGDVVLEVLATPGHTPESISVVVYEHAGDAVPYGVLTGDTLFVGDVGRPDLLASAGISPEEMASTLYDSLHDRLLCLPDTTRVFPAYGAGSACGRSLGDALSSTIGEQRRDNPALAPTTREAFVAEVTAGQVTAPGYFSFDAGLNRTDHDLAAGGPPAALGLPAVLARQRAGAVVIDSREPEAFAAGHLRGSVNVALDGRFAEQVGSVVAPDTPLVLVGEPGTGAEARTRLARIGYDHVQGELDAPAEALASTPDVVETATRLGAADLRRRLEDPTAPAPMVIDARNSGEVELGAVPGARNVPLASLQQAAADLDPHAEVVVYCAGGRRSSTAASLLRSLGFTDVADLDGGYPAWGAAAEAETAAAQPKR